MKPWSVISVEDSVAVLLASGLSRRFGERCKLLHEWRGLPLIAHAASVVSRLPFMARIAVVSDADSDACELTEILTGLGFAILENDSPERGQDHSLRLGIASAARADNAGALICLADMPCVTERLIWTLIASADGRTPAACRSAGSTSPPCYFPRSFYAGLVVTDHSCRPRDVLNSAPGLKILTPPADLLLDFDTPQDFDRP